MDIQPIALFLALPIAGLVAFGVYFLRASLEQEGDGLQSRDASEELAGKTRVFFYGACILMAIVYIIAGTPKLGGFGQALTAFENWGYSTTFLYTIGVLEFFGGIMLLIPHIRFYAACYLSIIMVGAIYTHLAFDPNYVALLPSTCLALLVFIAYESYDRGELTPDAQPS